MECHCHASDRHEARWDEGWGAPRPGQRKPKLHLDGRGSATTIDSDPGVTDAETTDANPGADTKADTKTANTNPSAANIDTKTADANPGAAANTDAGTPAANTHRARELGSIGCPSTRQFGPNLLGRDRPVRSDAGNRATRQKQRPVSQILETNARPPHVAPDRGG